MNGPVFEYYMGSELDFSWVFAQRIVDIHNGIFKNTKYNFEGHRSRIKQDLWLVKTELW